MQAFSILRKLLVTGGAGYLGRELVRRSPWPVRAAYFSEPLDLPAEWVQADVRELDASLLDGVDAVIHTAYRQGEDEWSTNVDGSAAVARASRGLRLVHLSTDLVFDGQRGRYREEDPVAPVGSYGESKAEAERLVAELHGSPLIVRTSLIYGGAEPGPQERLARDGTRFYVDEIRSPVHVGDLADALLELVALDIPARFTSRVPTTCRATSSRSCSARGRSRRANTPPGRAPDVSLDSSRAQALLQTRLRGVYETLSNDPKRSSCT